MTNVNRTFADVVRQDGRDFGIFLLPVYFQTKGSVPNFYPQEQFRAMCDHIGVQCLDLLPKLRAAWHTASVEFYYDHCHMTPAGNAATADILVPWVESLRNLR